MIRRLSAKDRDAWMPLWRGYQNFHEVGIPDAVSAITWARLLDPAEPIGGAHAEPEARQAGCSRLHWLTHETNADAMALYDKVAGRSGFVQYRKAV